MSKILYNLSFRTLVFLLGAFVIFSLQSYTASATTAGFKAGEIMDDTVMTNDSSMSVSQIQNFLNSKVPSCDTNGQKLSEYGGPDLNGDGKVQRWEWGKSSKYKQTTFPCLKNYVSGGKSAAQIIYEKGKKYSINPQVLIVLLQKEQGLVTDTWPLNVQYKTATGYGCPDTAPCASQYFGLSNQLDWAAKMYNSIITQNPNWYSPYFKGTNPKVYWNPDTGRCGSAPLNIVNWTTASLYSYTPYRPNQAALNAGYGTGNSCSSYGNRNFYSYFTDWFGSTTTPLFKIKNADSTVYMSYGDRYYPIPSPAVLSAYGLSGKKVLTVDAGQLDSYTKGPMLSLVVKYGSDPTVYLVDSGMLHPVQSWSMLNHYGYGSGDLVTFSDSNFINALQQNTKTISQLARRSDGAMYFLSGGKRHVFVDYTTYSSLAPSLTGSSSLSFNTYSNSLLSSIPESSPVLRDGVIVKAVNSSGIYLHDNDKLLLFNAASWREWGKRLDYSINSIANLDDIPSGGLSPLLISDGVNKYVIASGKRYIASDTTLAALGINNTSFTNLNPSSISRLPVATQALGTLLRNSDGTVYKVISQKRYAVASGDDFNILGYRWSDVVTVDKSVTDEVPLDSSLLFAPGALVRTPDGQVSLIDSGFKRHVIPSADIFNAYRFSWKNVRNYPASALASYTSDTLTTIADAGSGSRILADTAAVFTVSSTAYGPGWYNMSSWQKTSMSSTAYSRIKPTTSLTQFIQGSTPTVYKVVNGQKRSISSPASLFSNGGSWASVKRVSDSFINTIPTGPAL